MTFVHPLLLGGLAFVGLPILIHLLLRPRPRRLPFPAFQFLVQKQRTNQRSLRLRQLLLLLLRIALLALLCLALAGPRLAGGARFALGGQQPLLAILVVDTSPSMEYGPIGKTWFEEARRRAAEILEEIPPESRVAILDSGESGGEWSATLAMARERLASLRVRPISAPLTRTFTEVTRLFEEASLLQDPGTEPLPRLLIFLSDRTMASWDEASARQLPLPHDVTVLYLDVGSEGVADVALVDGKTERAGFWPGENAVVQVTVRATGTDLDGELLCSFNGETSGERRPIKVPAGRNLVTTFSRPTAAAGSGPTRALGEGLHQVEVRLVGNDALAFNNASHATFRVFGGRRVLVLCDDKPTGEELSRCLSGAFQPEVRPVTLAERLEMAPYSVVFLVHASHPSDALWLRLGEYLAGGGGVVVVPGADTPVFHSSGYASPAALALLPARLVRAERFLEKEHGLWREFTSEAHRLAGHGVLAPFRRWRQSGDVDFFVDEALRPQASQAWRVEKEADTIEVARFGDPGATPALLERGRVLMLTTPLEPLRRGRETLTTTYFTSSFGLVLLNLLAGHLAGAGEEETLCFATGQAIPIPLPARPFSARYTLLGPGVAGAEADIPRQAGQKELRLSTLLGPGNFNLMDSEGVRRAAFSVFIDPEESNLERIPLATLEETLGEESVVPVDRGLNLGAVLRERGRQPTDLAPWLLGLFVLVLLGEGLMANFFYRDSPESPATSRSQGPGKEEGT